MRYFLRMFMFHTMSLWIVSQLFAGLVIDGGWQVLLTAGFILTLLMLLVAPVLRILFIPITFLTLGLLGWLVNVVVVYLLTILVPGIAVRPWTIPAYSTGGFSAPETILSYPVALTIITLALTVVTHGLRWATDS